MTRDHLSDEAIAAIADDVLTGHARERARRHISRCPECNYAVAVQREAVWALRAAPAPSLPSGLMDRLRDVPVTTPVTRVPTTVDDDGTAMFAVAASAVALVPTKPADRTRRSRALTVAVASAAAVTVIAGGVVAVEYGSTDDSGTTQPAHVRSVPGFARVGDAQLAGVMAPMHW